MVDARITQTQSVLSEAILELASEKPVSEITVSDITRRAGINRATFYNHYSSPGALLGAVIASELDAVREADHALHEAGEHSQEEIARRAIDATVEVVQRHRRLYELALLDARDASLHRALAAHFEVSSRQHLANYALGREELVDEGVVARFVAEGIVGAIEVWLGRSDMSGEQLTDAILSAMPQWWH